MGVVEWGVVYRVLDDEEEHALLRLHILDVPDDVDKPQIKKALERAGRTYGEGRYLWGNHSILPRDRWPAEVQMETSDGPAEAIAYADLLDEGSGERRVTLRLPVGLHMALVKSASGASTSLNQFCLQSLASAVAYDLSPTIGEASAEVGGYLGVSQELLDDIWRLTPPEVRQQLREQAKVESALPPERLKNRMLAAFSQAATQVAAQAEHLDTLSDDEWEAMAVKFGLPGNGPQLKAEHERKKANRPGFLAHMARTFAEKSEMLRDMPPSEVKVISAAFAETLNMSDAEQNRTKTIGD